MPPLLMALGALVVGWILFQSIGSALVGVLLATLDVPMAQLASDYGQIIQDHIREVILFNTVGQVLGLGALAWLLAWLHSSRWMAFLRLREVHLGLLALSVAGLVALLPLVYWLGALNETIPLPDTLQELEDQRRMMLEGVIQSDLGLLFSLLALAVTPALCEELLFRGYVQRQFERGLGVVAGIVVSGVLFGLFHLSILQAIPLSVLGIYLAYVVWRTGSLWTGIAVHFANNAISVVAATVVSEETETTSLALETVQVDGYIVVAGLVGFALVLFGMHRLVHLLRDPQASQVATEHLRG